MLLAANEARGAPARISGVTAFEAAAPRSRVLPGRCWHCCLRFSSRPPRPLPPPSSLSGFSGELLDFSARIPQLAFLVCGATAARCRARRGWRQTTRRRVLQPYAIEPINPFMAEMKESVKSMAVRGLGLLDAECEDSRLSASLQRAGAQGDEDSRQAWREFCYGLEGLGKYCAAAVVEEEALRQETLEGRSIVDLLRSSGVLVAARVDQGFSPLNSFGEQGTSGLVLLPERCEDFYKSGVRIGKWRTQLECSLEMPTDVAVWENADMVAKAAQICQANGLAALVEIETSHAPGSHSIERTAYVCEKFLSHTVRMMNEYDVNLEAVAFCVDMCTGGPEAIVPMSDQVAIYTTRMLSRTLPPATGCVFLLGGKLSPQEAVRNARAVQDAAAAAPWQVVPVYGPSLLAPVMAAWAKGRQDQDGPGRPREVLSRLLEVCRSVQLADAS
eukprot:TRINITY_DN18339_c0_g1_i1.p1 TRINITY_DN18339_c0_g1~~TRINITY_DN18339_c0_g1_i1.p1  ORF type:complete len:445 (+),score=69.12 TRINITY_DN18339_c0_g1_i1:69-1403(+)